MSRIAIERHDSALGRWEKVACRLPVGLGPHVLGYSGYAEATPAPFRRLEPSNDEVHVIFSFGPEWRVPEPVHSFVAAPDRHHAIVEHDGYQHGAELRLTPLGAQTLLGLPMDELACEVVALDALLGAEGEELVARLCEASGWAERFDVLDAWLVRRLADAQPPDPGVEHAWWRLVRSRGRVPVAELVRETGWSRRHLTARFKAQVGLPPKVYGRILRFREAARELARPDGPSLCEIALDCGYYDQAHLNRDFREFAGRTPTELMAARLPGGGYRGD